MNPDTFKMFPLGDSALTLDLGDRISENLNEKAIALSKYIDSHPFPGLIETVPAYTSMTVYYDLLVVRRNFPAFMSAFEAVKHLVENAAAAKKVSRSKKAGTIHIPVRFDRETGPDLESLARRGGLSTDEVIKIFTETTYRVFMLGFLPGFSYLGEVDERIAAPRHDSPRLTVPKGSVGIAGKQTGIYSLESPGGWQIIGRTETELFSPKSQKPCLLSPGDQVRFVSVQ
jgi:inhibitor of KinA